MNIFVASVNAKVRLISLFVVVADRFVMCSWMPGKYPTKVRIEKIIRGKALQKHEFVVLSEAVPVAMADVFKGKTVKEWMELVGTSYQVDGEVAEAVSGLIQA